MTKKRYLLCAIVSTVAVLLVNNDGVFSCGKCDVLKGYIPSISGSTLEIYKNNTLDLETNRYNII